MKNFLSIKPNSCRISTAPLTSLVLAFSKAATKKTRLSNADRVCVVRAERLPRTIPGRTLCWRGIQRKPGVCCAKSVLFQDPLLSKLNAGHEKTRFSEADRVCVVRAERLELSRREALDPKSSVSTNSTTPASWRKCTFI